MMKLQLNRIIVPLVLVVGCTTMCTTIQAQATEPQTFYGESSLPRYAAIWAFSQDRSGYAGMSSTGMKLRRIF